MLFAKVPHHLSGELPNDRPYTRLEAWFQYDMDIYTSKERTEREYSRMWSWSRGKVARFISEILRQTNEEMPAFVDKTDGPKAAQRRAKSEPLKPLENNMLPDVTGQRRARDEPKAGRLFIRENKKEESLSLSGLWNEIVIGILPAVRQPVSKEREKKCAARLKERPFEEWREVFNTIITTPFLCGCNERGWKADFDWIIANDGNAAKVLEGKYKNITGRAASSVSRYSAIFAGA